MWAYFSPHKNIGNRLCNVEAQVSSQDKCSYPGTVKPVGKDCPKTWHAPMHLLELWVATIFHCY